jgi:hypothetical protein
VDEDIGDLLEGGGQERPRETSAPDGSQIRLGTTRRVVKRQQRVVEIGRLSSVRRYWLGQRDRRRSRPVRIGVRGECWRADPVGDVPRSRLYACSRPSLGRERRVPGHEAGGEGGTEESATDEEANKRNASSADFRRTMLETLAIHVRENYPTKHAVLGAALRRVRAEGVRLGDASALSRDRDGALLAEGDEILRLLAMADRERRGRVAELERLVDSILGPEP